MASLMGTDVGEWRPLQHFRCPIDGCLRQGIIWMCSDGLPLYISYKGYIRCETNIRHVGKITNWTFNCGNHRFNRMKCSLEGIKRCLKMSTQFALEAGDEWINKLKTELEDQIQVENYVPRREPNNVLSGLVNGIRDAFDMRLLGSVTNLMIHEFLSNNLHARGYTYDKLSFAQSNRPPIPQMGGFTEKKIYYLNTNKESRISEDNDVTFENFNTTKRKPPPLVKNGIISGTAKSTCDTILVGFEMMATKNILFTGKIAMDECQLDDNGRMIQHELSEIMATVHVENTDIRTRFSNLDGLLHAVQRKDVDEIAKIYYRAQDQHTLDENMSPYKVEIFIHSNLNQAWVPHIRNAITSINTAAPGLYLYESKTIEESKIQIGDIGGARAAWTMPHERPIKMHLGKNWPTEKMKGTSLHELMHALGFAHEMQRSDADLYLDFPSDDGNGHGQYRGHIAALTRFDPFSVLMYGENEQMKRKDIDLIWKMKTEKNRLQELSELDKVALNLLYKPCRTLSYAPKISTQIGMLYCGRTVMKTHDQCTRGTTDDRCGPNNWANCPACRVIKKFVDENDHRVKLITKLQACKRRGMWQGLSGLFYCGSRYSTGFVIALKDKRLLGDGVCGINNGFPCTKCGKELIHSYVWQMLGQRP